MSELDKFVQPDLALTINKVDNNNYKVSVRRPPTNRAHDVDLPGDITQGNLEQRVVVLRADLTRWSKQYNDFLDPNESDRLRCSSERVRPLWDFLAGWGRDMYSELFNIQKSGSPIARLAKTIKSLKVGAQILIDAPTLVIPWGLLYDGELPSAEDPHYVAKLLRHFWGFKYQIELRPPYTAGNYDDNDYVNLYPYLDNTASTQLTVSINKKTDVDYKTGQMEFFGQMAKRFGTVPEINNCRETVIRSMIERKEPQHLFYFFCHHAKGEGVTSEYGSTDFKQRTRLMMDGERDGIIQLKELKQLTQDQKILNFKFPPLIFLNACDSSQLEMGNPSGFMEYFTNDLRSVDYIGTEANIPALFADKYGARFIEQFFEAKRVGRIMLNLNRFYAKNHSNPFGLYYNLFGLAELRLNTKVKEIKR